MTGSYSNEIELKARNGMGMLILLIILMLAGRQISRRKRMNNR